MFCRPEPAQRSSGNESSEISARAGTALRLFRPKINDEQLTEWKVERQTNAANFSIANVDSIRLRRERVIADCGRNVVGIVS